MCAVTNGSPDRPKAKGQAMASLPDVVGLQLTLTVECAIGGLASFAWTITIAEGHPMPDCYG